MQKCLIVQDKRRLIQLLLFFKPFSLFRPLNFAVHKWIAISDCGVLSYISKVKCCIKKTRNVYLSFLQPMICWYPVSACKHGVQAPFNSISAILIIPVFLIILCRENVVFSNKTRIKRLCEIIIPVGLTWGYTVNKP